MKKGPSAARDSPGRQTTKRPSTGAARDGHAREIIRLGLNTCLLLSVQPVCATCLCNRFREGRGPVPVHGIMPAKPLPEVVRRSSVKFLIFCNSVANKKA